MLLAAGAGRVKIERNLPISGADHGVHSLRVNVALTLLMYSPSVGSKIGEISGFYRTSGEGAPWKQSTFGSSATQKYCSHWPHEMRGGIEKRSLAEITGPVFNSRRNPIPQLPTYFMLKHVIIPHNPYRPGRYHSHPCRSTGTEYHHVLQPAIRG